MSTDNLGDVLRNEGVYVLGNEGAAVEDEGIARLEVLSRDLKEWIGTLG